MILETLQDKVTIVATNRKEQKRFAKFAVVGAIGAVVDFIVLNLLAHVVGLPPLVANAFSFSAAVISNFTWNRLWSFPESRERPLLPQFGQFALINMMGLAINTLILWAMYYHLLPLIIPADLTVVRLNLAKAVAIGVVLFWNFGVNRITTYKGI